MCRTQKNGSSTIFSEKKSKNHNILWTFFSHNDIIVPVPFLKQRKLLRKRRLWGSFIGVYDNKEEKEMKVTKRDGRIVEKIGTYDPMTDPATIKLDKEKVEYWIKNGAKPTDTVKALIEKAN